MGVKSPKVECERGDDVERTVDTMSVGQVGVTRSGHYYLRTVKGVTCLNDVRNSYQFEDMVGKKHLPVKVRILPPSTVLKITVNVLDPYEEEEEDV